MKVSLIIFTVFFVVSSAVDENVFFKLGYYQNKEFYIPKYLQATWTNARSVCKTYGMDIASFETLSEFHYVSEACRHNREKLSTWLHVGGITSSPFSLTEWFWVTTGQKVAYEMPWNPGQPDNAFSRQSCLAIGTFNYLFDDVDCYEKYEMKFICQTTRSHDWTK